MTIQETAQENARRWREESAARTAAKIAAGRAHGICDHCGSEVYDGAEESGWTGDGPDWCADGDYGCDSDDAIGAIPFLSCGSHSVNGDTRGHELDRAGLAEILRADLGVTVEADRLPDISFAVLERAAKAVAELRYFEEMGS